MTNREWSRICSRATSSVSRPMKLVSSEGKLPGLEVNVFGASTNRSLGRAWVPPATPDDKSPDTDAKNEGGPVVFAPLASAKVIRHVRSEQLDAGQYDRQQATAMATVANALIKIVQAGELEERTRDLEQQMREGQHDEGMWRWPRV